MDDLLRLIAIPDGFFSILRSSANKVESASRGEQPRLSPTLFEPVISVMRGAPVRNISS
jgi:hypothetical protein